MSNSSVYTPFSQNPLRCRKTLLSFLLLNIAAAAACFIYHWTETYFINYWSSMLIFVQLFIQFNHALNDPLSFEGNAQDVLDRKVSGRLEPLTISFLLSLIHIDTLINFFFSAQWHVLKSSRLNCPISSSRMERLQNLIDWLETRVLGNFLSLHYWREVDALQIRKKRSQFDKWCLI